MKPLLAALLGALAGCAQIAQGPSLAGYPGLTYQLSSYYSARALEENATCTRPRMLVSGYQIVEDTPSRLVMNVRYHYVDEGRQDMIQDDDIIGPRFAIGPGTCNDFATRTFVLAKSEGGPPGATPGLTVTSMTGPQRTLPPNSALQ